jgi:Coiled-coil domain containing protein (DUF2052)
MTTTEDDSEKASPSTSPPASPLNKATIHNRRLTYLDRSDYLSSIAVQERLFPLLYQKLIIRHESPSEKLDVERTSKSRTLTNVLLDAGDHMDKLQQRRDRTTEQRASDEARYDQEQAVAESIPKEILVDREKSKDFLEKMIREKFMAGGDDEFDYSTVDEDDIWDDWETLEEDIRGKYFDDETPDHEEEGKELTGETGVQDF